jgi:asparagine synthase (glutamine-hydrolysing)
VSGIVGVFNLDGRPVDPHVPSRMLEAIAHRGPDRRAVWSDGPVALGHCLFSTTPESIDERQPYRAAEAGLSIVFDGRIDNREELVERFDRERIHPTAAFDAAYALCAYRTWGEACAAELLGDFAFAIWDGPRRRLFCARDVAGVKTFYYHRGPRVFLFASEPQAVLRHPAVSGRPDEGMIGEYLSVVTSIEDTAFADIKRLPRACRLVVSADACDSGKYWEIDAQRTIRYDSPEEYGHDLRSLLADAVRVRLRSCSPVGVMLSGGVDSSSILAMAASMAAAGRAACEAYSMIGPGQSLDETEYIDQVVAMYQCRSRRFSGDTPPAADYRRTARVRADVPPSPNACLPRSLKRGAQRAGVRVLLSGIGGDEWFGGSHYGCSDLLTSFRWWQLMATVRARARCPEVSTPGPLVKVLLWPQLPFRVRKRIKMVIGRDGVPKWIQPDFARRIALADRLFPDDSHPPFPTAAQRTIYREMTSGTITRGMEEEERSSAECGVETRHPFTDRRLIEFGMAIPEALRWRRNTRKFILRDAMRGRLPDPVRLRLTSGDASPVFIAPLRELAREGIFRAPAIERHGWADGRQLRAFHARVLARHAEGDSGYGDAVLPLWTLVSTELWTEEAVDRNPIEEDRCEKMLTRA